METGSASFGKLRAVVFAGFSGRGFQRKTASFPGMPASLVIAICMAKISKDNAILARQRVVSV